jgi:uncharacterized protein (TIGR02145 family)
VTYDDQTYKTVVIGTQTWMAEDLNYNATTRYNWATAMALDASCNYTSCSNFIESKHRGICPEGWHIPSKAEWNALVSFIENDNSHLQAARGWYFMGALNNTAIDGKDTYGFAALPNNVNNPFSGAWWSASEVGSYVAYLKLISTRMGGWENPSDWEDNSDDKSNLSRIRCLKD